MAACIGIKHPKWDDRLCMGPALLFADPMIGQGIQRIDVDPLPPPMALGLITLRGIPLSRPARQLASMFQRHLNNLNVSL